MDELASDDIAAGLLHLEEEHEWALDIVCGMEVDPKTTIYHTNYKGEDYYFCNQSCQTHFINNPTQYIG